MFSARWPYISSTPDAPKSSAVCNNTCFICALVKLGNFCFTKTAAPTTLGAEKDVPLPDEQPLCTLASLELFLCGGGPHV